MKKQLSISVIVPVMNEIENVDPLHQQLTAVLAAMPNEYEIVVVDDGSSDGTRERLQEIAATDPRLKLVFFRRNFGQTAAMQAGIDFASGDVVITIDGDLQNDPTDIPMMMKKIEEGFDLVHGWRKHRQDAFVNRKLPSKIANWLISRVTGFPIHDLGCTLKAIRREVAQEIELYGEMHRFIPILAHTRGAKCVEVETKHHPRIHGKTKYGIGRTFRVVLDLMTVRYMQRYFNSPMKLFGWVGLWSVFATLTAAAVTVGMKIFGGVDMTGNPFFMLTVLAGIASIQFFSLGLLGEVNSRIYYAATHRRNYTVRELVNFDESTKDVTRPIRKVA